MDGCVRKGPVKLYSGLMPSERRSARVSIKELLAQKGLCLTMVIGYMQIPWLVALPQTTVLYSALHVSVADEPCVVD